MIPTMVSVLISLLNDCLVNVFCQIVSGILASSQEQFGTSLLRQAYDYIKSTEKKGVSGREMGIHFGLGRLNSRTLIRNLERAKSIAAYTCNEGRQKLRRYATTFVIIAS